MLLISFYDFALGYKLVMCFISLVFWFQTEGLWQIMLITLYSWLIDLQKHSSYNLDNSIEACHMLFFQS